MLSNAPLAPHSPVGADPLRASVNHLLSRAQVLPCSAAAQAFAQLVPPTSRFQLTLDVLLPLLGTPNTELAQRILVCFILYSLYAPHPIAINPFKSVLFSTFVREKDVALRVGGEGESAQLVWVLWKILKGDGNDIGPYSPSTLARSPLPPTLRPANLTLDEETYASPLNIYDTDASNQRTDAADIALGESDASERRVSAEDDARNDAIAHAMALLLAARERVLTLSEQRLLTPALPDLLSPLMLTSLDLAPLIAHNPTLAHPLLVALLSRPQSQGSDSRPETQSEPQAPDSAPGPGPLNLSAYLDVLKHLPPTLPSFDLLGRLLRDPTPIPDPDPNPNFSTADGGERGKTTVADLVRGEVLGRFLHESINWLDSAERDEREGRVADDRFVKGVLDLCRFYTSLLKLSILDPASDADSAEMRYFALRNSHFEEVGALFRVLGAAGQR